MNTLPIIATVADLQRRYRPLVDEIKRTGDPMVIVNHRQPDVVLLGPTTYNTHVNRMKELEETYLLAARDEALEEYKKGKTIKLRKDKTLIDIL